MKKMFFAKDTKGEKLVEKVLISKGGIYIDGKNISRDDAKFTYSKQWPLYISGNDDRSALKCDFALFLEEYVAFIEYDGEVHFRILSPNEKGFSRLFQQYRRDLDKNSYCEENKHPLLRIKYDQQCLIEELVDELLINPEKYIKNHNPKWETYYEETEISIKEYRNKKH